MDDRLATARAEFVAAQAEVERIAELWFENKAAGRDLTAAEQDAEEARRRYRKWERKVRKLEKAAA